MAVVESRITKITMVVEIVRNNGKDSRHCGPGCDPGIGSYYVKKKKR